MKSGSWSAAVAALAACVFSCGDDGAGPSDSTPTNVRNLAGTWLSVQKPTPLVLTSRATVYLFTDTTNCTLTLDTAGMSGTYAMVTDSGVPLFSNAGTWSRQGDSMAVVSPTSCVSMGTETPDSLDSLCTKQLIFHARGNDSLYMFAANAIPLSRFFGIDIAPIPADPVYGMLINVTPIWFVRAE